MSFRIDMTMEMDAQFSKYFGDKSKSEVEGSVEGQVERAMAEKGYDDLSNVTVRISETDGDGE